MPDRALPYDQPSHPAKRHSARLTDGPDRAPARAMLKAIGFTDEDLARPIVGVATSWIETMPCNYNQRRLAEFVKEGIRAAGGTPMEFGTIAVSDGVSMGTEGMKASLVSREVVADSIETVVRGHLFDGLVCLVGCDKTIPGAAMALARLDVPGLVLYNGTIYPGVYKGRNADIVTVFEAVGAYRAGTISLQELYDIESASCPGAGACGGQYTANTMSMVMELIGLSPARAQRDPGGGPGQGRRGAALRRAGDGPGHPRHPSLGHRGPAGAGERDRGDRRDRRLHQRRPPPARAGPRGRPPARDRRLLPDRRRDADRRRPQARRPVLRVRDVRRGRRRARHARAAQARPAPRRRADGGRADDRGDRRDGRRDARPAGGRADRDAPQGERRPHDPARLAGAGRLRHQARRPRAAPSPGPGPRLRLRERLLRGRQGRLDPPRAT